MRQLLFIYTSVFVCALMARPLMGAGWFWDLNNALGFAAFAGMLYLSLPVSGKRNIRLHQLCGYAVVLIALAHVFWFLLWDSVSVVYIKPGAPAYMWTGVASVLALFITVAISVMPTRRQVHQKHSSFKHWHRVLAIAALATATHHIVVSGYYLVSWYQIGLILVLTTVVCLGRRLKLNFHQSAIATPRTLLGASALGTAVFASIRNFTL